MRRWIVVVVLTSLCIAPTAWAGSWRAVGPQGSPAKSSRHKIEYEAGKGAEAEEQDYQARQRWQEKKAIEMLEGLNIEVTPPATTTK